MNYHSPGPWKLGRRSEILDKHGHLVATVHGACDDHREDIIDWYDANLHLITAAPDLLAALEYLVRTLDRRDALANAQRVIAQAKGRAENDHA